METFFKLLKLRQKIRNYHLRKNPLLEQIEQMENRFLVFLNYILIYILKPIDVAVKQVESSNTNLVSALELVKEIKTTWG